MNEFQIATWFHDLIKKSNDILLGSDFLNYEFFDDMFKQDPYIIFLKQYIVMDLNKFSAIMTDNESSFFHPKWYKYRLKLFDKERPNPGLEFPEEAVELSDTVHKILVDKNELINGENRFYFIKNMIKEIIKEDIRLDIELITDDIVIFKRPQRMKSVEFDDLRTLLKTDNDKLKVARQSKLDVSLDYEEVHSLFYDASNDKYFYLPESLMASCITKDLTFHEEMKLENGKPAIKFIYDKDIDIKDTHLWIFDIHNRPYIGGSSNKEFLNEI